MKFVALFSAGYIFSAAVWLSVLTVPALNGREPSPESTGGASSSSISRSQSLGGHWQGSLRSSPFVEMRLALVIEEGPVGTWQGLIISLDQGGARVPLTALSEEGGAVHLAVESLGGTFDGRLSADGSQIAGEWKQGGGAVSLAFERLAEPLDLSRPQDPTKPYPYGEEEVMFANSAAGIRLAGTLTLPKGAGPHPAVVLISGSGPQDRDEGTVGHRPFLVLADHLTRRGIAVLRYDDRGIGRSEGAFPTATHEDFVEDALAAVTWLAAREEIDLKRVGLVGHSEGGIVAPLAAVKSPKGIAFIVLLAGPGVPMDELLMRQTRELHRVAGVDEVMIARSAASQKEMYRILRENPEKVLLEKGLREAIERYIAGTEAARLAPGEREAMIGAQIQAVTTPWFRKLLVYDPRPTLREVKCPVLAINGGMDLQVAARENLAGIRGALAEGGNRDVTAIELPGLNHLFQICGTGAISEYGRIEETFNPVALYAVSDWLRRQTSLD